MARRDELLDAAAELFAVGGFAGVTMDDIGAATGISGPALYHHFDSKESMLGEMLVAISEHLLRTGEGIVAGSSPADRLRALVAAHVEFAVDSRALITVQYRDLVHASDADRRRVQELQRSYVDLWVAALLELQPATDPRVARSEVHAVFGLINSTPYSGRLRRDALAALLERMALDALRLSSP